VARGELDRRARHSTFARSVVASVEPHQIVERLWTLGAELRQQREMLAGEEIENTPFSGEEQEQIAAQLTEAKEYVRANFELEPGQVERIEEQLDYLVEAAQRVGRLDWRNLLVGSFLSLVLQAVIPVQPVQQLLFIVLRGLARSRRSSASPTTPSGR
jgi:hypothetical protein